MNVKMLNAVKNLVMQFANEAGINLADHFKTQDEFTKFIIGLCVKTMTDAGLQIDAAWNLIFGGGAYEKLASDLWNQLNAV